MGPPQGDTFVPRIFFSFLQFIKENKMPSFRSIAMSRPSAKQLIKLRRGEAVRVSQGEGFNLIVHLPRYNYITRCFDQGKGSEVSLSPEELAENEADSSGSGIFGKSGDKVLKKMGVKKIAYKVGDIVKPALKAGINTALGAAATSLSAVQPELAPVAFGGAYVAGQTANHFLDKPGDFGVGHGINPFKRASLGIHLANAQSQMLARKTIPMMTNKGYGAGLGAGLGAGIRESGKWSAIGVHGNLLQHVPQALQSQPYSAHFMWASTLPVDYQQFNSGGRGSGLYA